MTYPFVAGISYGSRKGPVQAFVTHMAEGGNTVAYLRADATPPARGVSVHYVLEYSGRVVQMVKEDEASGSINPNILRTTEGPAPYGATVRKLVMGTWDHDPNSAVISLEIEGFAKDGPNAAQRTALVALVNDVRSRYPDMGLLGHRDFTDTKACPGGHIDWAALGGHGPYEEGTMRVSSTTPLLISAAAGAKWRTCSGTVTDPRGLHASINDTVSPFEGVINGLHYRAFYLGGGIDGPVLAFLHNPDVTTKPVPTPPVDCSAQDAKIAAALDILS